MPSATCKQHGRKQDERARTHRAILHRARGVDRMQQRDRKDRISQQAVIELHGENVLEEIAPQRRIEKEPRGVRHQRAVDQRPGVVGVAGAQSGHQRAEIDLRQHEHQKRERAGANAARQREGRRRALVHPPRREHERHIDQAGEKKMRRQPVLRDFHAIGEARGHHPPADRALQRAEPEDEPQQRAQRRRHGAAPQEEQKRQQERRADHAAKQTVRPFPPINRLERVEAHAAVDLAVLRDGLIFFERRLPGMVG